MKVDVYFRQMAGTFKSFDQWNVINVSDPDLNNVAEAFEAVSKYLAENKEKWIGPMLGFIKGGKYDKTLG